MAARKKIAPVNPMGAGWVSVEGTTTPYVGTGLPGEANKIAKGEKVNIPATLAAELVKAKKVKEI